MRPVREERRWKQESPGTQLLLGVAGRGVVDRIVWAAARPLDPTRLSTDRPGLQGAGEGLLLVHARLAGWEGGRGSAECAGTEKNQQKALSLGELPIAVSLDSAFQQGHCLPGI